MFSFEELFVIFEEKIISMKRIIAKKTLREFWEKHSDCEQYLKTWYETVKFSSWENPNEVRSEEHTSELQSH